MKIKRVTLALVAAAGLAGCTTVGAQLASSVQSMGWTLDTKGVPSGRYVLDPNHTSLLFKISHLGYSLYVGRFDAIHGTIAYDHDHPEASKVLITVDPSSIDTNNPTLEMTLIGKSYFDVAAYPQATYAASSITIKDDRHGTMNAARRHPPCAPRGHLQRRREQHADRQVHHWLHGLGRNQTVRLRDEDTHSPGRRSGLSRDQCGVRTRRGQA